MGAYTCEFGVVHKTCRCPEPHTIKCTTPDAHAQFGGKHKANVTPTKRRVVLKDGQVADLAWLMQHVLDSGVTDGKRLAAIALLNLTRDGITR